MIEPGSLKSFSIDEVPGVLLQTDNVVDKFVIVFFGNNSGNVSLNASRIGLSKRGFSNIARTGLKSIRVK